ncbi:MAG: ABC transporter permease [Stackebrandtia sp.]
MTASAPAPASRPRGLVYRLTRNKVGVAGFVIVGVIVLMTVLAPLLVDSTVPSDVQSPWAGVSAEHPLGTDNTGKDILHQILVGGGTVMLVGFGAAGISTVIAVMLGSLAAYLRGWVDNSLLQLADIVMTVPQIVLILVMATFFQLTSPVLLAVLIGCLSWPILMRSIRAQALSLKEREFVEAAKLLDLGTGRIVFGEIVPNMAGYILINFVIAVTNAIYALVGIYVLGLVPLAGHNWGIMIRKAWTFNAFATPEGVPFMMAPIVMIALLQLGLIMLNRSLEEVFNPRLSEG